MVTFLSASYPALLSHTEPVAEAAGDTNNLIYASPVILICSLQAPHSSLHLFHAIWAESWPQSSSITFSPMAWWAARVTAMEPSREVISPRRAYMVFDRPSPPGTGTRFYFRTFFVLLSPPKKSISSTEIQECSSFNWRATKVAQNAPLNALGVILWHLLTIFLWNLHAKETQVLQSL